MYVLYLYASKAFDHSNNVKLLRTSLQRNVCSLIVILLYIIGEHSSMQIKWWNVSSELFLMATRVKKEVTIDPL